MAEGQPPTRGPQRQVARRIRLASPAVLIGGREIRMRARTARWVAGCAAAGSVALMAGAQVVNISIPVAGFVLASRRPANRIGWLALTTGLCLGLSRFGSSYGVLALV